MAPVDTDLKALAKPERLTAWLAEHAPELGIGPLRLELVSGGPSNVIIGLDRGGPRAVLRRPPATPPPGSAKSIAREGRVLSALNATDVPHPHVYAQCDDAEVIGGPFYIMERLEGWSAKLGDNDTLYPPPFDVPPYRYGVPYAMTDALIKLANVDYQAIGLGDYGRPDNFLARQVERWSSQLASYKTLYNYPGRELPGYEYTRDWLAANVPDTFVPGIIHGDVGTPNAFFYNEPPCRVRALIDWELSTIGDPLVDFAWFANALRDEREPDVVPAHATFDPRDFPTRQDLARYYAAGSGRDISRLAYYLVLSLFKGACIVEYKVAEAQIGLQSEAIGKFFSRMVLEMFAEAERIARRADREPHRL
jgi:aminoglycoside phosphotransferase (APT) family kinase protein